MHGMSRSSNPALEGSLNQAVESGRPPDVSFTAPAHQPLPELVPGPGRQPHMRGCGGEAVADVYSCCLLN